MNDQTKTIELIDGYTDKKGAVHKTVTFGKRLTVSDLINVESGAWARNSTRKSDLLNARMMTKFGELKTPVDYLIFTKLNRYDREDLEAAAEEFIQETRGDATTEILSDDKVRLFFGFQIDGVFYDTVQLGNTLTGQDFIDAADYGNGNLRQCFEIGREIIRLESSENKNHFLDGTIDLEKFESLDLEDFFILKVAAENWRASFRQKRRKLSQKRNGAESPAADKGNGNVGTGDSDNADVAN